MEEDGEGKAMRRGERRDRRGWVYSRFAGVGHQRLRLSLNSFSFRFRSGTLPRFMGTAHSTQDLIGLVRGSLRNPT